jgi:daunorubicin/doxorubicin transport system ATP-binding protein
MASTKSTHVRRRVSSVSHTRESLRAVRAASTAPGTVDEETTERDWTCAMSSAEHFGYRERNVAIETSGLTKAFGETRAVDRVDLSVPSGVVYALLGPNGAGKTTTIRLLATLLRPDAGEARVFGHDVVREPDAVRSRIALTGQFASVDADLTGRENLVLLARLLGFSRRDANARAQALLEAFDLADAAGRQARRYSGGMRRRLDIAASLIVAPALLFLDEPTTGLDPRSRNQVWQLVRELLAAGTTVLLTTQYLDEADQLADRVAVIDHGTVVAEGTPGELKASAGQARLRVRLREPGRRPEAARLLSDLLAAEFELDRDEAAISARVSRHGQVPAALARLADAGIEPAAFEFGQPSLDEVFLALTGHQTDSNAREDEAA